MIRRAVSLLVVVFFVGVAWQQQAIADWWYLQNYEPSEEIAALAERSHMSEEGKRLFYLSDPQINDKEEFNQNCPIIEKSFTLGCYANQQIYILNIDREELEGIMEVTAAHEMLHAAYDRLSTNERDEIVAELEDFYAEMDDEVVRNLIEEYEERGGISVRHNELHSIIPSQVVELSGELEDYFAEYFTDRQAVAEMYKEYESVFIELDEEIASLKDEISALRSEINSYEQRMNSARDLVENLNNRLDQLEAEGQAEAYNELVPEQNQAVSRYNGLVDEYRLVLNRHNQLVDEVNQKVIYQRDLVNSLDSTFDEL